MTERQMDILYYLHAQDDFVPVSDISVALQVSVKTIRNELLIIQEVIKKESLGTLEKKPRLGIKLVIEAEVWERYTRQLESKGLTAEEADEKSLLIYYLLTKGQINYTEIQKYLYMGRSAAERLIPEVEKWLKNRSLKYSFSNRKLIMISSSPVFPMECMQSVSRKITCPFSSFTCFSPLISCMQEPEYI